MAQKGTKRGGAKTRAGGEGRQARDKQRSPATHRSRPSAKKDQGPLESLGKAVSAPVRETADEEENEKGESR